ncbi:hypothetical protein M378DRAFT_77595 [Amanita muscaria Koide BX008]|uniref:Uncharacterized protein n=1 Tax=Amanita muscaria (strain Koide BX008) TaxID=946122 RepID=A0A0C2X817_AMAMK|nr:hypothetical protein M378DRAFT_77595 [Amanita muscaria Koide BX008]
MVGAFHGYAHERACQLAWHPLYMKGTGRTEGEGCEHIFSSSNDLARNTRYASQFHRHQAINDHFKFWDQDKYALLSTFIVNHYRQAVQVIKELEGDLANNKKNLGCSDDDFERHFIAEQQYLSNLEKPDPVVEMKKEYVKSLRQLAIYRQEWETTRHATINFRQQLAASGDNTGISQATFQAEISYGQVQNAEALVTLYEVMLGVSEQWTENSPEYRQYYKENVETSYRKAVDELERAVVMRIWELTKMKATGTGTYIRLVMDWT